MLTDHSAPPFWLRNPHIQTLWPKLFRKQPELTLQKERVELRDGDFIDLSWTKVSGPRVIVLHGLEGSLSSHYAMPMLAALNKAGLGAVFMHFRGTSEEPNRLHRTYHSGASEDLDEILHYLKETGRPIVAAVGFSLGGNLLLKYLGEAKEDSLLQAAVAISVPFQLQSAGNRLERGFSKIYQTYLLDKLKRSYMRKFNGTGSPLNVKLDAITTLREYDELITAPLNGFASADEYYTICSCSQYLKTIITSTLILHAKDDPFMYEKDIPTPESLGKGVQLSVQDWGGHVGFVMGGHRQSTYLTDHLIPKFILQKITNT